MPKIVITLLVCFICLVSTHSFAQVHIQPEFGQILNKQFGINNIGSVRVTPNSKNNPVTSVGLTIGYNFKNSRIDSNLRMRYFTGLYGFLVADLDEDNGPFGPVVMSNTIGVTTINVQPIASLKLLQVGKFAIFGFVGPSLLLQFPNRKNSFDLDGRHLNTVAVVNQIEEAVKPMLLGGSVGGIITYWRLSFTVDYHSPFNKSFTDKIRIGNTRYSFSNSARYVGFSLGYRILGYQEQ